MTKPVNVEWLQGRVTDLEAEVKLVRKELDSCEEFLEEVRVMERKQWSELAQAKEALRRVVVAASRPMVIYGSYDDNMIRVHKENGKLLAEALAFAKGVMSGEGHGPGCDVTCDCGQGTWTGSPGTGSEF